jgi:hypothetical protein
MDESKRKPQAKAKPDVSKLKRKRLTAGDNGGDKIDARELAELLFGTIIFPTYPFRQGQTDARWRINIPLFPNELFDEYKRLFRLMLLLRQRALTPQERKEFNQLAILLEQRMPLTGKELDLIMQTVGSYAMSKIGKFLQQRCNVPQSELNNLSWTDILEHLTLQADLASKQKKETEQPIQPSGDKAKQRLQKKRRTVKKTKIEQSLPLAWYKWANVFGVSENTLRKWRKDKKYHFNKVSGRKWTLPKNELPAEYLEKYRHAVPQTQPKTQ